MGYPQNAVCRKPWDLRGRKPWGSPGNFREKSRDLLEVPTICKAYSLGLCKRISQQNMARNMVLAYLHFRILEFPLTKPHNRLKLCGGKAMVKFPWFRGFPPGALSLILAKIGRRQPRGHGWAGAQRSRGGDVGLRPETQWCRRVKAALRSGDTTIAMGKSPFLMGTLW